MPYKICKNSYGCGPGHICTMHYNLGYKTCQYNLKIGSSVCFRKKRSLIDVLKRQSSAETFDDLLDLVNEKDIFDDEVDIPVQTN